MDGRTFKSNLMGIAQEKYFYKLRELGQAEIEFLQGIIALDNRPVIRQINMGWIEFFGKVFEIRDMFNSRKIQHDELDRLFDILICNYEEQFQGKIEAEGIKYLEALYKKDLSFLDDDDELIQFLFFVCQQYMRTEAIKSSVLKSLKGYKGLDVESIWTVLRHIQATSMGFSLYQDRKKYRVVLIENESSLPFITGDQPIVNTCALSTPEGEAPEELELYYPLSPELALLLTEKESKPFKVISSDDDVASLNNHIVTQSSKQVFASEIDILEALI
tara:strand:- start:12330 stop:13154 length:825 start_codon:yes stop_codon:yes gene_type:complete